MKKALLSVRFHVTLLEVGLSRKSMVGDIDRRVIKRVFRHHKNRCTALRVAPK
jgi:hypothetical protein